MLILQYIWSFKKTLPWSQTQILIGVKIIQDMYNLHAYSSLGVTVKITTYVKYPEKHLSLPNKLPNEF